MINLIEIMTLVAFTVANLLVDSSKILSQSIMEKTCYQLSQELPITDNLDVDPFALMKEESLGELRINLAAKEVIQLIGNPEEKDQINFWEADGLYHQYWYYPNQGITLNMESETKNGQQNITFIKLVSPSTLQTKRGIKVGSSLEEVSFVYAQEKDQENSIYRESFVAGSIYGGLIFTFKNGYVSEIFLGATAE
jgi:hypothetical protein